MARLIEKKKGYNTYLRRVVFNGYDLRIEMLIETPDEVSDLTPVRISLAQTPLRGEVLGRVATPPMFFEWAHVRLFHEKPFEDAVRLIRRLSEMCVSADFELREKDMVRLALNSTRVIYVAGNVTVRRGSSRKKVS